MPTYSYTYIDRTGKKTKGTLEAASIDRLRAILQVDGNIVVDVKQGGALNKEIDFSKIKPKDLGVFCEQMHSIIKAGIPAVEAIKMVTTTTQKKKLKKALNFVIERIVAGIPLSTAMEEFSDVFPLIMVQMIKAGEESGTLDEVFYRLSLQFKKQSELKNQIKKALAYPKMIIMVVILAVIVVCAVVVPQFVEIFAELGTEVPITTKFFIFLSKMFTTYWWVMLIFVISAIVFWTLFKKSQYGIKCIAKAKLKIPLFKNLEVKTASADFARTMSTLLRSGMDYPKALEIASETMSNVIFKEGVISVRDDVINGSTLTSAMIKINLFPELLTNLLRIGEDTGNVEQMLENSASYFEDEVQTATMQLTSAINPIIMVVLGVFVGALVYSIYTPMFSLYNGIG